MVEQLICNHQVASSIPAAGTNILLHLAQLARLGFLPSGIHVAAVSLIRPSPCKGLQTPERSTNASWNN